ncbi:MAG: (Fe-S)-binding protein [Promethearchaeota archaeon]
MFNEKTCQRCGICLEQCPFMHLPREEAKVEIARMIETRKSRKIIQNCASCSYCNVICPTQSNPWALRKEIRMRRIQERGITSLALITEDMSNNLMTIGLEIDTEAKRKDLKKYINPPKSKEIFYLGCAIPYIFPNLAKTKLLEDLPLVGGIKYCCSGYTYNFFGEVEAQFKGKEFLDKFRKQEVEKLISFCPGCEHMIKGVYPSIVEGFNIQCQNIIEYLIEKYHKGELVFKHKINQKITFQDPCPWRKLDNKVYEGPRELIEIMGAEFVEMKHNKEKSLCCGAPVATFNRALGKKIAKMRIKEATNVGADSIAFICTGCLIGLSRYALSKNIEPYYITELAQMAIGETPYHKILETSKQMENHLFKKISENPNLMKERYIIKNGKITRI